MALTIRKIADFDVNSLTFSAVRKNDKGGRAVYLNSNGGQKLLFQLPQMRAPFGLSEFTDKATGRTSYSMNLSLDDEKVRNVFQSIDNKILDFVVANSEACLGKKYSVDIMREALFKSAIKPGKDNYAPTLQLKVLPGRDGKGYAVEAYNSAKQPVDLATLEKVLLDDLRDVGNGHVGVGYPLRVDDYRRSGAGKSEIARIDDPDLLVEALALDLFDKSVAHRHRALEDRGRAGVNENVCSVDRHLLALLA